MNRRLAVTALATLLACSSKPAPVPSPDAGPATTTPPTDGLKPVAAVEPNESPQTAQKITESSRISAQINPVQPASRPDEDWYLVAPAQPPQDLSIAIAPEFSGAVLLEVYDRDRNRIMAQTVTAEASAAQPRTGPQTHTAFPLIRVRDEIYVRVAAPKASGKYTLELRMNPADPDREAEPNDKPIDATALPLDHPMHGMYETEGDKDFFVVELVPDAGAAPGPVPAPTAAPDGSAPPAPAPAPAAAPPPTPSPLNRGDGGPDAGNVAGATPAAAAAGGPTALLRINLTAVPGVRHSITVFDDNQVPFATFLGREVGAPLDVRDLPLRPGLSRVMLLLESAPVHKKRPASDQPYTLTVHRESAPAGMELEPNDTLPLATPIEIKNGTAHAVGWLSPQGDVDYYKVHLDAPARVHVVLSPLERVDTELEVLDAPPGSEKGTTVLKVNEGGPKEPEVIPALTLPAGDHYFKVIAASHKVGDKWVRDQEDPEETYTLEMTFAPNDGAFEQEPNDTPATATPLVLGKPLSGFLFPSKDLDVYRLDLSGQPVAAAAKITVTGVTRVPVWVELREASGNNLGELLNSADPGKPGMDATIRQKLDPGVYYLMIRPHPASKVAGTPQADAETPYKVSVELE